MNLRTYLMLKRAAYYNADELEGQDDDYLAKLQADSNNKFSPEAQAILDSRKKPIEEVNAMQKKVDNARLLNDSIGAVGGGTLGAGLGYAGSSWLAKKLGLKGRKALAAKLLGTTALGAAGAYGGYRLGDYASKKKWYQ